MVFGHLKPETFLLLELCLLDCSFIFSFNFWNQRSEIQAVSHRWIWISFTGVNGGGGRSFFSLKFCLIFPGIFWKLFSIDYMLKKEANFFFFFIIHLIQCLHLLFGLFLSTQMTDFASSLNFKTHILGLCKWKGARTPI